MRGFNTRAVHIGEETKIFDAVSTPIFQTSNFVVDDEKYASENSETFYTRVGNPSIGVVERKLSNLFGGTGGIFFSSGMGAITTVFLSFLRSGMNLVISRNIYGGTQSLLADLSDMGVEIRRFDQSRLEALESLVDDNTGIVYVESMTNPNLILSDIQRISHMISKRRALLVVDNTFLSPYNFRPLEYGADVDVQSLSKYVNGHSDVIAGFAAFRDRELETRARQKMIKLGTNGAPFEAFLVSRGVKTLGLRMELHNNNAKEIALFLTKSPKVRLVSHPSLRSSVPNCFANCRGFGGVVYLEVKDLETAKEFIRKSELFLEATSLAGVESLATIPILTSHSSFTSEQLREVGLSEGGVRLSVGIENIEDLLADLDGVLKEI
ncbi:MAG: Cystathionine beta-lyases/cystathionine gamma-synthase [Mesotoga infera]|uniref:Cystathionine beta-lyases/cystathionine gamma-synthase n=3 Tax=Mesotoga infera TaxID=1236046 RepID=A0A101H0F2_9BACT|nr:MAG: Cystathionine beta-lyases/cystathionine gamma-synthase [Mesotoga infera]